mgnify:CR=1 FL=1
MKVLITVEGETTRFEISDKEASILVETDYQERLKVAKDKAQVQRRTPQQILNSVYSPEKDSRNRLHNHWVRPNLCTDKEGNVLNEYDTFALARPNQGSGYSFRNMEALSTRSAECQCLDDLAHREVMRLLRDNLTPEQIELVTEVIFNRRKQVDYAAEKDKTKSAISQQLKKALKKLEKILKRP